MVKVETGKNTNLTKVLDLITTLKREELLALNEAIINLLKSQQAQQAAEYNARFKIGDIVVFTDENQKQVHGMVSKKNPKTIQVTTTDSYTINVPPRYLAPSPIEEKVKAQFQKQFQQFTEKFNIAFNK
jgi:hypothetical protein